MNALGTTPGDGAQGAHQNYGQYVRVNGTYDIWDSFDWKTNKLGSKYKNQMFHARGIYTHINGSLYLSLYNNQGKWLGYINEKGTSL